MSVKLDSNPLGLIEKIQSYESSLSTLDEKIRSESEHSLGLASNRAFLERRIVVVKSKFESEFKITYKKAIEILHGVKNPDQSCNIFTTLSKHRSEEQLFLAHTFSIEEIRSSISELDIETLTNINLDAIGVLFSNLEPNEKDAILLTKHKFLGTLLHLTYDAERIRFFVNQASDEAKNDLLYQVDKMGNTLLTNVKNAESARVILEFIPDHSRANYVMQHNNFGVNPIHNVTSLEHLEVLFNVLDLKERRLLAFKRIDHGSTPLHLAKSPEIAKALIDLCNDESEKIEYILSKNKSLETALENPKIAEYLFHIETHSEMKSLFTIYAKFHMGIDIHEDVTSILKSDIGIDFISLTIDKFEELIPYLSEQFKEDVKSKIDTENIPQKNRIIILSSFYNPDEILEIETKNLPDNITRSEITKKEIVASNAKGPARNVLAFFISRFRSTHPTLRSELLINYKILDFISKSPDQFFTFMVIDYPNLMSQVVGFLPHEYLSITIPFFTDEGFINLTNRENGSAVRLFLKYATFSQKITFLKEKSLLDVKKKIPDSVESARIEIMQLRKNRTFLESSKKTLLSQLSTENSSEMDNLIEDFLVNSENKINTLIKFIDEKETSNEPPSELLDIMSCELMMNPQKTPCGHTFDQSSIDNLENPFSCPLCRQNVEKEDLELDQDVKTAVENWIAENS